MPASCSNDAEKRIQTLLSSCKLPKLTGIGKLIDRLDQLATTDVTGVYSLISDEAPLSKGILRLVNTRPGLKRPVQHLREAVLTLGVEPVRDLAMALSYVARFREDPLYRRGVDFLWQSSLMTAIAARQLANQTQSWDEEQAFLAGLVSDCGVLVMYRLLPGYRDLMERFRLGEDEGDLVDRERAEYGLDHSFVSARLLERWGMKTELIECVAAHHPAGPEETEDDREPRSPARILHAAWICSRGLTVPGFAFEGKWLPDLVGKILDIPKAELKTLRSTLSSRFKQDAQRLGILPRLGPPAIGSPRPGR